MDKRVDTIYNIFQNICIDHNYKATKTQFNDQLFKELATNSAIPRNLSLTEALNFAENELTMSLSDIASFIFDEMSNENKEIPLTPFIFKNSHKCCLAPHSTVNFDTTGVMRVCCFNNKFNLGAYPSVSILEAWNNPKRKEFIKQLESLDFSNGCEKCKVLVSSENPSGALFSKFNRYDGKIKDFPINFEFEFGTICNYECIMCGGKWSSSIRKNREKLPPIQTPYDDNFVDQLKSFIPHLRSANFLGGEPFLTPLYYKIWDLMYELNKNLSIYITTNGSILNDKIISYLTKLPNSYVVISLDSLKQGTYELIRRKGNFANVMNNFKKLLELKKVASIAVCPVIQNVYELPDIVNFCSEHDIGLHINTVTDALGGKIKGIHENEKYKTSVWIGREDNSLEQINHELEEKIPEFCLNTLPKLEIMNIINHLSKYNFSTKPELNHRYIDFVAYLGNLLY